MCGAIPNLAEWMIRLMVRHHVNSNPLSNQNKRLHDIREWWMLDKDEWQRTALKAFFGGQHGFCLFWQGSGETLEFTVASLVMQGIHWLSRKDSRKPLVYFMAPLLGYSLFLLLWKKVICHVEMSNVILSSFFFYVFWFGYAIYLIVGLLIVYKVSLWGQWNIFLTWK